VTPVQSLLNNVDNAHTHTSKVIAEDEESTSPSPLNIIGYKSTKGVWRYTLWEKFGILVSESDMLTIHISAQIN